MFTQMSQKLKQHTGQNLFDDVMRKPTLTAQSNDTYSLHKRTFITSLCYLVNVIFERMPTCSESINQ